MTAMEQKRVLVVDDEADMRETCRKILSRKGYAVEVAADGGSALRSLAQTHFDLAIVDLRLPDMTGIALLREVRKLDSELSVVIITAYSAVDTAVEAVRAGAFDYLAKPFSMAQLELAAERGLDHRRLLNENRELQRKLRQVMRFEQIVAISPQMTEVLDTIRKVGGTDANVLLRGETGTGKELVARAIHAASARSQAPWVPIDCASVPENLLESEMFGYEKGAFTGASAPRCGLLETANGGTLFLDEIGDLSSNMQAKLLRVLQERQFRRVGGREMLQLDIRLIAATNRNLEEMMRQGSFREDLLFRLNVVSIELPPLRERPQDIAPLANFFLEQFRANTAKNGVAISSAAMMILERYRWPGNVRELKNAVQRALSLTEGSQLTPLDLPPEILESASAGAAPVEVDACFRKVKTRMISDFERAYLTKLLADSGGNVSAAARRAGIRRSALHRLIAKYRLQIKQFR